jgi:small GTP-binding protein
LDLVKDEVFRLFEKELIIGGSENFIYQVNLIVFFSKSHTRKVDAAHFAAQKVLPNLDNSPHLRPQSMTGCRCRQLAMDILTDVVRLSAWGTAGQELCRSIVPEYVRNAASGLLVYRIKDVKSFQDLEHWKGVIQQEDNVVIYFVCNKIDLSSSATVSKEQAQSFAYQINAKFVQASALQATGVIDLFKQIAIDIARNARKAVLLVFSLSSLQSDGCY